MVMFIMFKVCILVIPTKRTYFNDGHAQQYILFSSKTCQVGTFVSLLARTRPAAYPAVPFQFCPPITEVN